MGRASEKSSSRRATRTTPVIAGRALLWSSTPGTLTKQRTRGWMIPLAKTIRRWSVTERTEPRVPRERTERRETGETRATKGKMERRDGEAEALEASPAKRVIGA